MAETHVGKEELFKTGNFDYDDFFEDLYGLQGSAKAIVADEKAARAPLGQALGVGETSIDRMLEVLRDKAESSRRARTAFISPSTASTIRASPSRASRPK